MTSTAPFCVAQKVLFKHCDPAGIVFYPRYFEMMNDCVEAFFDHIGHPFEAMHAKGAVPTVKIAAEFANPSRHGDQLTLTLTVCKIGKSSLNLKILVRCQDQTRMTFDAVLVNVGTDGTSTHWPDALRAAFAPYFQQED